MTEAWRPGYPKTTGRFCVNARLGYEPNVSWVHKSCDDTSWDAAPCSACSLAASVQVNTEFKLLGLCERYVLIRAVNESHSGTLTWAFSLLKVLSQLRTY